MAIKTLIVNTLAIVCMGIFASCDKGDYSPLQTSTEACQIVMQCLDRTGTDLLDDKKFAESISIEGDESHSRIKFDIKGSGNNQALFFTAELPDQNDMIWSSDKKEANGISKITIKFKKHKVTLKCHIKYVVNRPPTASGGKAYLEEVSCNKQTFKRSGNSVTITLRMDENGNLL